MVLREHRSRLTLVWCNLRIGPCQYREGFLVQSEAHVLCRNAQYSVWISREVVKIGLAGLFLQKVARRVDRQTNARMLIGANRFANRASDRFQLLAYTNIRRGRLNAGLQEFL